MNPRSLLVFDLDGARFGVDAGQVLESVWLPELTPVEEAPVWVAGVFNLRGRLVVAVDLRRRLGHPPRPYGTGDRVVVMECGSGTFGLIVSDVIDVIELAREIMQPSFRIDAAAAPLVIGKAQVGDALVGLLDVSRLSGAERAPAVADMALPAAPAAASCQDGSPEALALFRARAAALREAAAGDRGERLGFAVVMVGGEYFGLDLSSLREFCEIRQATPVPCCPAHILGVINLRGELVSLIDPRGALDLPATAPAGGKAVIGEIGGQPAAIAVDDVCDVIYRRREELRAPPAALRERHGAEIAAVVDHEGRVAAVLDLPALLSRREWIVDETV